MMKKILTILIAALYIGNLAAQEKTDSIQPDKGFDATQEMFQKRYRHPDAVPFDTLWKNNLYVTFYGGIEGLIARGESDFNSGPLMGAGINWQFAPAHTLRGILMMGKFARRIDNETLMRFGLQADYLLNVSTFSGGYNPGRIFEFLTVAGLGVQFSSFDGKMKPVADLHVGVQLKLHPTKNVDFFLEPRFSIMSDGIDHSERKNWHKYDMTYGLLAGVNYRFKGWSPFGKIKLLEGEELLDNTFVSIAGGGQWQSSKLTSEIGVMKSIGPHFSLSVGKWLLPMVALRASLFQSGDTWHLKKLAETEIPPEGVKPLDSFYEMSTYAGGRLEGMLDLTYFMNGRQEQPKFSLNLLAGGELGYIRKENGYNPAKGGYAGITGGLQLKYQLIKDLAVFVEPRTTMATYSLKTSKIEEGLNVAEKYTDNLFSINVGVEIRRANEEDRLARSIYVEDFKPSFFASGMVGFSKPMELKRYELKRHFGYMGGVAAGRIFTPLSSVRVTADFSPLTVDVRGTETTFNMISGSIDYMLNLSNLMMGFDPERKYDVQGIAGLVGSFRMAPKETSSIEDMNKSKVFMGVQLGAQASYQVHPRFKVFIEPKVRFYGKSLLMQSNIQSKDIMMSFAAGTSYSF